MRTLHAVSLVVAFAACTSGLQGELAGDDFGGPSGGGDGVDTGGAQDIGAARAAIERGEVPGPGLITVEGLLSEHDVPAAGPGCDGLLCMRPAVGIAKSLETGKHERWVHLGLTTGVDLATFRRPPIDLVIAIDKSSSMTVDIAQTTEAASRLVGHMRPDDRVAILAFDESVHVVHELGAVTDLAALQTSIKSIAAEGSWDIDMALDASYSRLATPTAGRLRRVIVMSCGYPQISPEGDDPRSQHIRERGTAGVGITFVGVLLGWDPNLAALLGKTNGANYYYLGSLDRVESVFDRDADLIVTPIAYDLHLALSLHGPWQLARMYGIPGDKEGAPASGYDVATAFFSRKRGSIVARLAWTGSGDPDPTCGDLDLSYRAEPALGLASANQHVTAMAGTPDADGTFFSSTGVRKATVLVNMAVQMIAACTKWQDHDGDAARAIVDELHAYMLAEQQKLHDTALDPELALVAKLRANME